MAALLLASALGYAIRRGSISPTSAAGTYPMVPASTPCASTTTRQTVYDAAYVNTRERP